ncbi:ester cyclase [Acidobacteria bacterium AH-259-L09]|nr:ester cyclase [Acidobacteria bacterium AH-259-L09]
MSEENKAVIRRLFNEAINQGNLSVVDEIMVSNCVWHDPANPDVKGPEGFKQVITKYRTAFPDLRETIEDIFAEGDKVVARYTWSATHEGDLEGIAPTGKHTTGTGILISHFSGGKVVEGWWNWDALGLMQQLGVVPEMKS